MQYFLMLFYTEIDLNGMDNMGDDSDSVGNAPRTARPAAGGAGGTGGGAGFTMQTKEKRKPFFKKVSWFTCHTFMPCMLWQVDF